MRAFDQDLRYIYENWVRGNGVEPVRSAFDYHFGAHYGPPRPEDDERVGKDRPWPGKGGAK